MNGFSPFTRGAVTPACAWPVAPDAGRVAGPGGITQAAREMPSVVENQGRLRMAGGYHVGGGSRRLKVSPWTTIEKMTTT